MARRLYPRSEPSMRDEMIRTLQGGFPEISKKMPALLRKMRRDANGLFVTCECVDPVTKEADKENFCPLCHGEGKKWDERYIDVYKVVIKSDVGNANKEKLFDPGLLNVGNTLFYTAYNEPVTENDKIVELVLDLEGKIIRPARRLKIHRITTVVDFRADTGRVEYLKLGCFEEEYRWLNG